MAPKSVNNFIRHALDQVGDKHRKGAEVSMKDADPDSWDSSELIEWSANQSGVTVNDGSWLQYRQLNRQGGDLSVDDALRTPGALVFTFSSDPMASPNRPTSSGVAISLGNGQVITVTPGGQVEVVDASTREFTHASVMPGFEDARNMGPDARDQLQDLMKEHGLPLPKPDLFDPDGDGVPMSPDEATKRVTELNKEAERLRDQAEHAEELHDRQAADVEVAKGILEARKADHQHQKDAVERAERAEAEAKSDLFRSSPELHAAAEERSMLQRRLGIPVPSDQDLIPPDGSPRPTPPPIETDPAVVEQLRGELVIVEAHVEQLMDDQKPLKDVLDQKAAERFTAQKAEQAAAESVREQETDVQEISGPLEYADAEEFLKVARNVEAEAVELAGRSDEVAKKYEQYQAAHPDKPPTDLGEIEVRVSRAEAYAQGRRERAGELEDEAADLESKSIADERAATERSELSDLRDERADDLRKRAEEATARAKDAQRQVVEARDQADEWGATADKRLADAARLRAQGRTDDADVMKSRAERATEASIEQAFRAGELTKDVETFNAQASQWQTEADELAKTADLLDDEAASLAASAQAADNEANKLQERAAAQDRIADDIDERLEAGVATTIRIKDDIEGTDVTIQIPGRVPTEADLDPQPTGQPSSRNEQPADSPAAPAADSASAEAEVSAQHVSMDDFGPDQFAAAAAAPTFNDPVEPQQDFSQPEPEPDVVDALFNGASGDDYSNA